MMPPRKQSRPLDRWIALAERKRRSQEPIDLAQFMPPPEREVRPRPRGKTPGPQPGPPPLSLSKAKTLKSGRSKKGLRVSLRSGYAYGGGQLLHEVVYRTHHGRRHMVRQMERLNLAEAYFRLFLKDKPKHYIGPGRTKLPWINPDAFAPKTTRPPGKRRLYKKKTLKSDYSFDGHRIDLIKGLNRGTTYYEAHYYDWGGHWPVVKRQTRSRKLANKYFDRFEEDDGMCQRL